MSAHQLAVLLVVVGALGAAQFLGLAFAARQIGAAGIPRLERRLANPIVRHANLLVGLSGGIVAAGLLLGVVLPA